MDKSGQHASSVFDQTAQALENSADLAEQHAQRHERAGLADLASFERDAAARARVAAQRARAHAERSARPRWA